MVFETRHSNRVMVNRVSMQGYEDYPKLIFNQLNEYYFYFKIQNNYIPDQQC